MADFTLPELGENITAGDVVRVLVSAGDVIAKEQPVLELETDKATIEVPSSVSGTIKDVRVKQGERIKVGQVVLTVDDGGAAAAPGKAKSEARGETTDAPKAQPAGAPEEGGMSQEAPEASVAPGSGARKGSAERDRGTVDSRGVEANRGALGGEVDRGLRDALCPVEEPLDAGDAARAGHADHRQAELCGFDGGGRLDGDAHGPMILRGSI